MAVGRKPQISTLLLTIPSASKNELLVLSSTCCLPNEQFQSRSSKLVSCIQSETSRYNAHVLAVIIGMCAKSSRDVTFSLVLRPPPVRKLNRRPP